MGSLRSIELEIRFARRSIDRWLAESTTSPEWGSSLTTVTAWVEWLGRGASSDETGDVCFPIVLGPDRASAAWRSLDVDVFLDARRYAVLLLDAAVPFAVSGRVTLADELGPRELSLLASYEIVGGSVVCREPTDDERREAWARVVDGAVGGDDDLPDDILFLVSFSSQDLSKNGSGRMHGTPD